MKRRAKTKDGSWNDKGIPHHLRKKLSLDYIYMIQTSLSFPVLKTALDSKVYLTDMGGKQSYFEVRKAFKSEPHLLIDDLDLSF